MEHIHIVLYEINPLKTRNPKMGTLANSEDPDETLSYMTNSEDPDEMPHKAAFHQGLHCLLRQNQETKSIFRERNIFFFWKIITCDPSIYTMTILT